MEISIPNKPFKDFTREDFFTLDEYLTREMWNKGKDSIRCPICGGTITTKILGIYGTSSLTECSTPGCVHFTERGI